VPRTRSTIPCGEDSVEDVPEQPQTLLAAFARLPRRAQSEVAYLEGAVLTIQLLRRHLVIERGRPRQAIGMRIVFR
jgi:hypothetical protein